MQQALTYRTNRDLFSNYYLDEHLPETEEWDEISDEELEAAYDEIMDLWEREKSTAPKRNESQLEEKFIRPMFRKLGIPFEVEESTSRTQRRPDYGFFDSEDAARDAFERREEGGDFYENAVAVADAKRWGRPLDTRGSGEHERDFENPSYQIHVYLQETPARWAVLTDGKKWRLYYGPTSHRLDSYYEVDLPTILESGDLKDFKYFYLFFQHEAFLEDASGDCFLDDVYGESNVFAQELGEDLQDNIYEAIKILSEGFLQYPENDLDENDLELIHDSSLIYLYRLIFVLYAEAEGRKLLDTSNEIYEQSYSLNSLKQEVAEELDSGDPKYRDWQDNLQSRLDELFMLIDEGSKSRGIPEEDLYIPAYNGGLFRTDPDEDDSTEAKFLANHDVGDAYLAKVVELLTRSKNSNGGGKIFVDYSSLDVRHLGSIYEGLLEYQLNVAHEPLSLYDGEYMSADEGDEVVVQEGEVYLTTGSGERKATGSYYTPEYVVEYIVENTLEPLVDDIRADLAGRSARGDDRGFAEEFAERVFDLKILDPAMGSGHFLTSAIDYLAREIIDAQEKQAAQQGIETVDEEHDINWARRQVAQRCIYGVDLNPLAVELAKVSLWLRTLAAEQPLAFLDHHLKTGNSLVGSDIEEIEELESEGGGDGQNASLADFGVARKGTIEQLMRIYEDFIAIENQELADVKEMESKYDEFERNKLRQRLEAMANVHTAEDFGLENLPSDAYQRMAVALENDNEWEDIEQMQWFQDAQQWAVEDEYFHWKLEYPEAFYTESGDTIDNPGFDAVIGNPPYVRSINIKKHNEPMWSYYKESYSTAKKGEYDIYLCFTELGTEILRKEGQFGYILPNKWFTSQVGSELRSLLVEEESLRKIVDFQSFQVFDGVTTYTCLLFLELGGVNEVEVNALSDSNGPIPTDQGEWTTGTVPLSDLNGDPWSFNISPLGELFDSLDKRHISLEEYLNVFKGLGTDADSIYCLERRENGLYSHELEEFVEIEDEILQPAVKGTDIDPYHHDINWSLIFPYRETDSGVELMDGDVVEEKFPKAWSYLNRNRDRLEERESGRFRGRDDWFAYSYPRSMHLMSEEKLLLPDVVKESEFSLDSDGCCLLDTAYGVIAPDLDYGYLTALLNTDVLTAFLNLSGTDLRGGYFRMKTAYLNPFPVPKIEFNTEQTKRESLLEEGKEEYRRLLDGNSSTKDVVTSARISDHKDVAYELLSELASKQSQLIGKKRSLNLDLLDYLGNYSNGPNLPDIGHFQPSNSDILDATTEDYDRLRVGDVKTECDDYSITIYTKARYKPDDKDSHETDRWGYTETNYFEAFTLTDLTEEEVAIVNAFVPVAIEKGDGFAGFRDNATKTNSPIDRLKAITLPDPGDVADDFDRYSQTKKHADELSEKIERTGQLVDMVVYELYELTEEEIRILEGAVQDD